MNEQKHGVYSEFKTSEGGWLGDIPAHWSANKLKFLASTFASNVDKKTKDGELPVQLCNYTDVYYNHVVSSDLPFMKATATREQIEKFTLRAGDTIITKDSEDPNDIAVPAFVEQDMPGVICGYHLSMVRPMPIMSPGFLNKTFQCAFAHSYFATRANGLTRYGLGGQALGGLVLPVPPLEEQTQIAKFLDYETAKIDALIEKQQQLIALLKEKRQAVISHVVTKGLNPDAPMRDSGVEWLGEVPAHWQVLPTKRLFSLECHPAPKNNDMELLSVYTYIGVRPRKELEQKGNKASTTDGYWIVKKGDLVVNKLLAWMGAVGYSNYEGVTSPAYDILRRIRPLNPKFYHYLFRLENTGYEFKRWSRGIMEMRLRLYFEELGKIQIPLPSEREQNEVVAYIEGVEATFDGLAHKAEEQIALLQERRTALISAAVTGKIDVRNWKTPDSEAEVEVA